MTQTQGEDVDALRGNSQIVAAATTRRPAIWRTAMQAMAMAALVLTTVGAGTARADGQDVCPEPNNRLQFACNIGTGSDALGFISSSGDVDAYRLVTLDYGARVHVALPDRPYPYRLKLVGYDGRVLHSTEDGTIDAALELPGTYYAVVDSATGDSDDSKPYRIELGVKYPGGAEPTVLYQDEYGRGSDLTITMADGEIREGPVSDDRGTYGYRDGIFFARLDVPGTPKNATVLTFIEMPSGGPAPVVGDFTMSIDTQLVEPADASYAVVFRRVDGDNFLRLTVDLDSKQAILSKVVDGKLIDLTPWTRVPWLRQTGVNRTAIRCVGSEIKASINGMTIAQVHDDTFSAGEFGYSAGTWGESATVTFDNILVTTPTQL
jgi:hypothetical protein